jgi:uncharacterized membrane protein YbhN (UPF0104 family)
MEIVNPNPQSSADMAVAPSTPAKRRNFGEFFGSLGLSLLFAATLLGGLIYSAGIWNIIANTRLLDLLIKSGIVKYHDRQAGFVEGVADHSFYLKSQEPVEWVVVALVMGIFVLFWALKAVQFHDIARYHGIAGTFRQHARAYLASSLTFKRFMPLRISDAAAMAELRADGASTNRIYSTLFLFKLFVGFEILVYGLLGLVGAGWSAWLAQLLLALLVVGVLYWWTRRPTEEAENVSMLAATGAHISELLKRPGRFARLAVLSLLAFGSLDISAYLLTMAFSTQHVLLHVDFSILLMAFVAGYVARQIPLTPGGIGQFEVAFAGALFVGGVGLPEAATVALLFSFFYYLAFGLLYLISLAWRGAQAPFGTVLDMAYNPLPVNGETTTVAAQEIDKDALTAVPAVPTPYMPSSGLLWKRGLAVAWVLLGLFFFDRLTLLLSNYWLLESMGYGEVFWTNFSMGATLFVIAALAFAVAVALPAFLHKLSGEHRRFVLGLAGIFGLLAGYWVALQYKDFLLWFNGQPFGEVDPVFQRDIGFYIFSLPGWWAVWDALMLLFIVALVSSAVCAHMSRRAEATAAERSRLRNWLGTTSTGPAVTALAGLGVVAAAGVWLGRYYLLLKEDKLANVFTGASYVDVTGLFSTLNQIQFTALVVLASTIIIVFLLRKLNQQSKDSEDRRGPARVRTALMALGLLIAADFAFAVAVSVRDTILVTPDQPVIQLPYIERHISATRKAYGLDQVEEIELRPRTGEDPLPNLDEVLSSAAARNAPLWPTYVNYLEQLVDPQHAQRILQTGGDNMIYGPTLEIFRQQEKLRTYYDFLDVDVLRYTIDGEKTILASAVRELPILEPQPWLAWWGQRFMLFTHGHGIVMAPVGQITPLGEPAYVSGQIPVQAAYPEISVANQQVYYGEGNASMAVSNVREMAELDYPTDQGRAENVLPPDYPGGVFVNSLLKRIVFGWRSGEFWEMVFSSLITPQTRIHYDRQPLKRLDQVAPFLYFEANPYAFPVDGDITWLINALTKSDNYPYSKHEFLGDKSLSRSAQVIEAARTRSAKAWRE